MIVKDKDVTLSTLFLLPILNLDKSELRKYGFINVYLGEDLTEEKLYLLFDSKEDINEYIEKLKKTHHFYVDSYNLINNMVIVVFSIPYEYKKDFVYFKEGKYSKLSTHFKSLFPETQNIYDSVGKITGKEHTIYYHIFNRTDWLIELWLDKLKLKEIPKDLELWDKPILENELLNIKKYENSGVKGSEDKESTS